MFCTLYVFIFVTPMLKPVSLFTLLNVREERGFNIINIRLSNAK